MNDFSRPYTGATMDMATDAGLRSFMLGVYNKLGLGLVVTAAIAYAVGTVDPLTQLVFNSPLRLVVAFGPLALLLGSNFFMRNPSPAATGALYWAVVALLGAQVSYWVVQAEISLTGGASTGATYTTIASAMMVTASAFFALSFYGYVTKRNLTGIHSALVMMTWAALPLIAINAWFLQSSPLMIGIQVILLAVYALLIVSQTQMLKVSYYQFRGDERGLATMTNHGALNLYIAVISIFQILMSFMGMGGDD